MSPKHDLMMAFMCAVFVTIWAVLFGGDPDLMDALIEKILEDE